MPNARLTSYPAIEETIFTTTNFTKGNSNNEEQTILDYYNPNAYCNIYVNKAYTGNYSNGDWRYPYKEIQQALNDVNIDSACLVICIKAGEYCPVYAVSKNFVFDVWPNQSTEQKLENATINSLTLISCHASIGKIAIVSHAGAGDYALRLENGSTCYADVVQNYQYSAFITMDSKLNTQGYCLDVTSDSGVYSINTNTTRTWRYKKTAAPAKILGRAGLFSGTAARTGSITLQNNAQPKHYTLLVANITVDGNLFCGIVSPTDTTIIPFTYYSGSDIVTGCYKMTANASSSMNVELSCYKNGTSFTPTNFKLDLDGIL